MTVPIKRWNKLAGDLEFEQLTGVRKQAEGWRTGLAGLTGLLAAVTIVKGPDTVASLPGWLQYVVVGLLFTAFGTLVWGTLAAIRAAAGQPGAAIWLDGDALSAWTAKEAAAAQHDILRATRRMLIGLAVLALAVGVTWLGPRAEAGKLLVTVEVNGLRACGELLSVDERNVIIQEPKAAAPRAVAVVAGIRILPAAKC